MKNRAKVRREEVILQGLFVGVVVFEESALARRLVFLHHSCRESESPIHTAKDLGRFIWSSKSVFIYFIFLNEWDGDRNICR